MPLILLFVVMMIALKLAAIALVTYGGHLAAILTIAGCIYAAHRLTVGTRAPLSGAGSAPD